MDTTKTARAQIQVLLTLNAAGFLGWMAGDAFAASAQLGGAITGAAFVLAGIGFGLWIATAIITFGQAWRARKTGDYDILGGEAAKRVRNRAVKSTTLVAAASLMISGVAAFLGAEAQLITRLLAGLVIASFLASYAWHDRQDITKAG